ncbi:MAG: U32 family peptidase [Lachnospiraceae bacterium]|nr:U32 family peptidase [Lachnospiraceae bacterium]
MISENTKNITKPELLAPAGNIESFYAVLKAGADAVYMAGSRFGARAYADNFSDEELIACIRYAHLLNKKIYLTVNTLVRNNEMSDLVLFLEPLYEAGLDGVIVQDIGVLKVLGERFPRLLLHASTQLSVTGKYGAEYLKELGVSRIVPARELSLPEIEAIKDTGVEVECFIHGAMCYSYSGACLFSSVLGGRSGNRGRCAQPCRLPYSTEYKEECYPLSLKDMSTIGILDRLINAGIDSFKIEGRMKKSEYAAGVTSVYRKAIDGYLKTGSLNVSEDDLNTLKNLYIRSEVSDGYYNKRNGAEMVSISSPSYSGADEKLLSKVRETYIDSGIKKLNISVFASFIEGEEAYATATYEGLSVSVKGKMVEHALGRPIEEGDVLKSFKKLGNTPFAYENPETDLSVYLSESPYYPLKEINELRRNLLSLLEDKIIESNGFDVKRELTEAKETRGERSKKSVNGKIAVSVITEAQLKTAIEEDTVSRIYVSETLLTCLKDIYEYFGKGKELYAALGYIRRSDSEMLRSLIVSFLKDGSLKGVLVRNIEDLQFFKSFKSEGIDFEIAGDYGLYAWNNSSIKEFSVCCDTLGLPLELSSKVQNALAESNDSVSFEKMVYGRYPLMQSANCIYKTGLNCKKKVADKLHFTYLKDRTDRKIPVLADCARCHNTLYNSVPLSLYKFMADDKESLTYRLDFTDETPEETERVLKYYKEIIFDNKTDAPAWKYTTGFEKKSCE